MNCTDVDAVAWFCLVVVVLSWWRRRKAKRIEREAESWPEQPGAIRFPPFYNLERHNAP